MATSLSPTFAHAATRLKPAPPRSSGTSSASMCSVCRRVTDAIIFELNDTQRAIKDAARDFFSKEMRSADLRRLIDSDTAFDTALWRKCADLGYTGMIFPEEYGGVGLRYVEMAATLE